MYNLEDLRVFDCEVYPNYTLFAFKDLKCKTVRTVELFGSTDFLCEERKREMRGCLCEKTTFGFNSLNYDIPVVLYAMKGSTAFEIYRLSKKIIRNSQKGWETMRAEDLRMPTSLSHFDIIGPAGSFGTSLKLYGARIHTGKIQELPYDPNTPVTPEQQAELKRYCVNDLDVTTDLYDRIRDRIEARVSMSKSYKVDLVSLSDAQISEKLLKMKISALEPDLTFRKPSGIPAAPLRYRPPPFLKFQTSELRNLLNLLMDTEFYLNDKGAVQIPPAIRRTDVHVNRASYAIGVGGLHSKEKSVAIRPEETELLIDKDVTAYYPSIIMRLGLYPASIGPVFLDVYSDIVKKRVRAKKEGNVTLDKILKIVINGTFGKLGSRFSFLYSPGLLLQVTLTGQLALLLLIERTELAGIRVVSANTDGFVSLVPKALYDTYTKVTAQWETDTGFSLEETKYRALYSRDVNTYLAITEKGTKGKGGFAPEALDKNPEAAICYDAVREFLTNGTPIEKTIRECTDIRKFMIVRRVSGGAMWKGKRIGNVARWVLTKSGEPVFYLRNNDTCPQSGNAYPVPVLRDLPEDLEYSQYILRAYQIMEDVGAFPCNTKGS